MPVCPICGQENPDIARFCLACGAALAGEAARAREERKVVTVLFCDLVGSTARAEGADPEDVRALLRAYHERVRSELERFGGTVEKFIGDAVMALFGAPTAHEDDPERAVRAALAIRDWAQEDGDLQVRIGITTGEALVSLGARPEAGEAMASGGVVNTAARLQSAAPVNEILVDETTYRATERMIDYGELEPIEAKGKSEPVPVWEALQARARDGVDVAQRTAADLIGRREELDVLVGALARVRRERSPQLVTLVGVPGIGKSRLVFELFRTLERGDEPTYWRQGRALPYGEGVTYWPLAEIAKAHAGILETDSASAAEAKLERAVREALDDETDIKWVAGHLRPLFGLAADAEAGGDRRTEAFAAWRLLFEGLAERRPFVLVFEDLQWADEGMLDFVEHLVEWASRVPLLILCSARPELLDRRPRWGGGALNSTIVSLSPLSQEDTARLIATLLEQAVMPAETQQRLLANAGGNPLYAEEYVRMLHDRSLLAGDSEDLPLPESIQGVVAARLDVVSAEEKALLQAAAVVGKVFWSGALAAITGLAAATLAERLHALERKDFALGARRSGVAGETEYSFRHIVVRDVAYGQIPRGERGEKHLRAAEWIESLSPDRSEDRAEMLAHHYQRALDLARATGRETADLRNRARPALREAGDRALALNAFPAAARYYERALELWPDSDADRPRVQLSYGKALHLGEQRGAEELIAARDALMAQADIESAADAESAVGELRWETDQAGALAHLEHAVELLRDRPASATKAYALTSLARLKTFTGKEREAIALCRDALALAEELKLEELRARALNYLGSARALIGDEGGLSDLERSIEVALSVNAPVEAVRAYNNLAGLLDHFGDTNRARELRRAGLDAAERVGVRHWVSWFRGSCAADLLAQGRWDEALELVEEEPRGDWPPIREIIELAHGRPEELARFGAQALEHARRGGRPDTLAVALMMSAYALLEAGEPTEAEEIADELAQMPATVLMALSSSYFFPVVLAAVGQADELERAYATTTQTPWVQAARSYVAEDFETAADRYAELDDRAAEAYSRLRAAEKLIRSGRRSEGELQLQTALAFYRSVDATRFIREGEALLAESA
jgi:class 3 adenylate cyclase/tetratricopeptide (TPR) repeat protein